MRQVRCGRHVVFCMMTPSSLASRSAQRRSPGLGPGLRNLLSPRADEEGASQVLKMDRVRPAGSSRPALRRSTRCRMGRSRSAATPSRGHLRGRGIPRCCWSARPATAPVNSKAACHRVTGGEGNAHVQAGETGGLAHGGLPDGWADCLHPRRTEGKSFFATGSMVLARRYRPWPGFAAVAPQNRGLLYFCGFAGWFSFTNTMLGPATPAFPPTPGCAAC